MVNNSTREHFEKNVFPLIEKVIEQSLSQSPEQTDIFMKIIEGNQVILEELYREDGPPRILAEMLYNYYASFVMASQGFYRYALISLRSNIELACYYSYFKCNPESFSSWDSDGHHINFDTVLKGIFNIPDHVIIGKTPGFSKGCKIDVALRKLYYDILSPATHGRGVKFRQSSKYGIGIEYNQEEFSSFIKILHDVYSVTTTLILTLECYDLLKVDPRRIASSVKGINSEVQTILFEAIPDYKRGL